MATDPKKIKALVKRDNPKSTFGMFLPPATKAQIEREKGYGQKLVEQSQRAAAANAKAAELLAIAQRDGRIAEQTPRGQPNRVAACKTAAAAWSVAAKAYAAAGNTDLAHRYATIATTFEDDAKAATKSNVAAHDYLGERAPSGKPQPYTSWQPPKRP